MPCALLSAIAAGSLAFGVLLRLHALDLPLDRDEGAYAYIATHLSQGMVPYRDVFDHKPPAVYLIYGLAPLFGPWPMGLRALTIVVFALSVWLTGSVAQVLYGQRTGLVAAIVYAALDSSPLLESNRANTEVFLTPLILAALWLWLMGRERPVWLFAVGLLSGLAIMVKPVAGLPWAVLVTASFWTLRPFRSTRNVRALLGFVAGTLAGLLPFVAWFMLNDALGAFWFSVVTFNSLYVQQFLKTEWIDLVVMPAPLFAWCAVAAVGFGSFGRCDPRWRSSNQVLLWCGLWCLSLFIGAKLVSCTGSTC